MSKSLFPRWAPRVVALAFCAASLPVAADAAATKLKLRGYLTARADANAMLILDDRIELTSSSRVLSRDSSGEHAFSLQELSPGMLVEAEGQWLDKQDRKSTRLNSSHQIISYAVFCLKKKNMTKLEYS